MIKRGYFFSLDALIAVVIVVIVLSLSPTFYLKKQPTTQSIYFSNDLLEILSTLRVGEINDTSIISVINESSDSSKNRTIIEQILRLQAGGYPERAEELAEALIGNLTPDYYGIGIWAEGFEEAIYSSTAMPIDQLISTKQMVSGIERDKAIEGQSARVFLTGINERVSSTSTYFGGYVGDGDITQKFELPSDTNIKSAYMELDINSNFDFYINGIFVGSFTPQNLNTSVDYWDIVDNLTLLHEGNNTIEFRFNDSSVNKYIGGGYFKVTYSTSSITIEQSGIERHSLPGISGIINLYDSFYVPGILQSMAAHLHYNSDYSIFFNIGNKTVYRSTDQKGECVIDIYDSNFSSLNYSLLSQKTIPLRLSTEATELIKRAYNADVILITDLSGSMVWRLDSSSAGVIRGCNDPQLYDSSTRKISLAKCLDKDFVGIIMNATGNRVGLVGFSSSAHTYTPNLDYTKEQLIAHINDYSDDPSGGTCICCAINRAYDLLSNSLYSIVILVPKKSSWLYNASYPLIQPPNDLKGNNWTSINYSDSGWSSGNTILGFEKTAYAPYVDTNISLNSVVLSNRSYNASAYFLINYSVSSGDLSDTYAIYGNNLNVVYNPTTISIVYDGFEGYYGNGAHQINGNDINKLPGYWYVNDAGQEVYIMANYSGYPAYSGTDVLVFRDMDSYGYAETTINLSAYTNPKLSYWWRLGPDVFDGGEYANVMVWDGSWHTIATYDTDDSDNTYHYAEIDISPYNKITNFKIRFGARSSLDNERFYIDDVAVKEERQPEIWLNSTEISYSEPFNSVSAELLFKSNSSANYIMKIYNFNSSSWESAGCDSGGVIANNWNDFWCFKQNPNNYISSDGKIKIGLIAAISEPKSLNTSIDFVQYYTTMMTGNYYFRKHFRINDTRAFSSAKLAVLSDDRAEVYLNGYLVDNDTADHNAEYWNRYKDINVSYLNKGDNVFAVKLYNRDDRNAKFDLQLDVNSSRQRYIIVMSDGITGYSCGGCGAGCSGTCTSTTGSYDCGGGSSDCYGSQCDIAINDAICSSCRSYNQLNATVYSIGFGPVSECYNANRTLRGIADCGHGSYHTSSSADGLKEIYRQIAENILSATYQAQFINVTGIGVSPNILYPDSYIDLDYTPTSTPFSYGLIPLTIESPRFGNIITEGSFYMPSNVEVYDVKLTSYSGDKWTSRGSIKNSSGNWVTFYNLSEYSSNYPDLGDPYIINIPTGLILKGKDNIVRILTAINPLNTTGGSPDDRAIYTIGIKINSNYTGVYEKAEGCIWSIGFEDGTNATINIPLNYSGTGICQFTASTACETDYNNDAVNNAVCNLLKQLDFDNDGKLFVKIGENSVQADIVSLGKIPYMWGPTLMEVRVWS